MTSLGMLTGDLLPVRKEEVTVIEGQPVTIKGRYYLNEEDLTDSLKGLLHGRAFVEMEIPYQRSNQQHQELIIFQLTSLTD